MVNKLANKPCIFISAHSSPIRHNCRSFRGQPSLQRFSKREQGEARYDDYDLLEGHWDLPNIWEALLRSAQLPTDLDFPVKQLSEGQNQVSLIRIIFKN